MAEEKKKSQVEDVNRSIYDIKDKVEYSYKADTGLTEEVIREISKEKDEPEWMLEKRLQALKIYNKLDIPPWAPDISELDMEHIDTYVRPKTDMKARWEDLPENIRETFDRLGIPEAEKKSLAGVGAQYDSEVVYHNIQKELEEQGVIYVDFETAVKKYPELIKPYFGKLITPSYHKFAALHYAVWSGGSFVYVPKGVHVEMPLQSYFRLNAPGAGQFEHTLIIVEEGASCHFIEGCSAPRYNVANLHAGAVELFVKKGATLRYSTIENWSKNMYNLNTKKSLVEEDGHMIWVSGSFGSHTSCLYPDTVLKGDRSTCEFTGITFAGKGQFLDTGSKVEALGKNVSMTVNSKSISKGGGTAIYRGVVYIGPNAKGTKGSISCESLMLDDQSRSDTIPDIVIENDDIDLGHEAKIGRIPDEDIYYLMSRGLSEEDAKAMLVRGFAEPISKALPLEYAVEMNRLIDLEFEGAIG
ncbi:Fe-S cluster assembly protein SufB [uncultured Dialister sp.]|jgi:Fe-S cluster assembly protein SufB|uniref:Fe-S cluster assembly protein SufB n=1 Tax=uncultured Dialister sp. TaxID=278064 RepID=UPI0025EB86AA|nr:Fe-S cluster assembly protein SufB [uncultured Dialister sp.]